MHWMSVKLPDNFQMRKHSWPCRFHIRSYLTWDEVQYIFLNNINSDIWTYNKSRHQFYYIIKIIIIVGHRCLWLSRTTSCSILRYFEWVPLLTRFRAIFVSKCVSNLIFFSTSLYPFLIYLYNMSFLVWAMSTRLLHILTESNSTSNPVLALVATSADSVPS